MYSCTGILGKQYFLQDIPGVVWIVQRWSDKNLSGPVWGGGGMKICTVALAKMNIREKSD